jgi:hypothetical protein
MDIQEIIKNRYKELPEDIQEAIKSNDLAGKFNAIAEKHGLHIDQNGALQTETLLVMLGLEPTSDYVNNIQRNLDISRTEALSIADDVNNDILGAIKNSLRMMQETGEEQGVEEEMVGEKNSVIPNPVATPTPVNLPIAPLEKAGQFTIEPTKPVSTSPQYKESGISRESVLKSIEDKPVASQVEPMIDHLLTTHVISPEKVEVKEAVTVPSIKKVEEKKPYTADPYREQI